MSGEGHLLYGGTRSTNNIAILIFCENSIVNFAYNSASGTSRPKQGGSVANVFGHTNVTFTDIQLLHLIVTLVSLIEVFFMYASIQIIRNSSLMFLNKMLNLEALFTYVSL